MATTDERLDDILRSTERVMMREGFANVRMSDVAQAAGISSALLHYHYKTKDLLLAAAFEWAVYRDIEHIDQLRRHTDPAIRLREIATRYFSSPRQNKFWVDAWGRSLHQPRLRASVEKLDFAWLDFLCDTYADGAVAGLWTCADARSVAWKAMASLDGILVHQVVHPDKVPRALAVSWAQEVVLQLVGLPASAQK